MGREPVLVPFPGESKVPFLHNPIPSSPSTYAIRAYVDLQVVSWPAPPSLSQCHPPLADGVVQGEEPAGILLLWACCLWNGRCQPLPTEAGHKGSGPRVWQTHWPLGQGWARSSPSSLPRLPSAAGSQQGRHGEGGKLSSQV